MDLQKDVQKIEKLKLETKEYKVMVSFVEIVQCFISALTVTNALKYGLARYDDLNYL